MPIQIGDILGDYQVTGVLGRGGMGKVYRVRSLVTEREEAMKVVLPDLAENPGLADRFLREIKVHASLLHPNIAALHTAMRIEGRLVMLLELVEGVSLEETLRRGPLEVSVAVHYLRQILAALEFAHERGVIHRDIKPANILLAAGGVVKLTDFGIARPTGEMRLTMTGLTVGTLAYMSPEQIRSEEVDARSDIYSLGIMAYEMVAGRRPIEADSDHALMNAQLRIVPPDPATVNPQLPRVLCDAIIRAVAKQPHARFQTARDFRSALKTLAMASLDAAGDFPTPPARPAPGIVSWIDPATPELAEIEARLSRIIGPIAGRLVADAARRCSTLPEIRQALAAEIDDPRQREEFLKTAPRPTTDPAATVTFAATTPVPAAAFDAATLERLAQLLAPSIGPIARVVVSRAARAARTAEELCNALANEIGSEADRKRFLVAARSIL